MASVSGAALGGCWVVLSRCRGMVVVAPRFGAVAYSSAPAVSSKEGQQGEGESSQAYVAVAAGVQPYGAGGFRERAESSGPWPSFLPTAGRSD